MKNIFLFFSLLLLLSIGDTYAQATAPDIDYDEVDAFAQKKVSKDISDGMQTLTEHLTKAYDSPYEKVRAIAVWMAYNIEFDLKGFLDKRVENPSAARTLKLRYGLSNDISNLFIEMCEQIDIQSVSVNGYVKGMGFEEGDQFYYANHSWNAVMIDSSWYMIDISKCSGHLTRKKMKAGASLKKSFNGPFHSSNFEQEKDFNAAYFLMNLKLMTQSHIPVDPMWQLTINPLPMAVFESDSKSIIQFVNQPVTTDTVLNYEKKLETYFNADDNYNKTVLAAHSTQYNSKNHRILAYTYGEYADYISAKEQNHKGAYKQAVKYYNQSLEAADAYKEDNSTIYKYEKEKLSKRHKAILGPNKKRTKANKNLITEFRKEKKEIKIDNKALKIESGEKRKKNRPTFTDNLNEIERAKKTSKKKAPLLLENDSIIAANNERIKVIKDSTAIYYNFVEEALGETVTNCSSARDIYVKTKPVLKTNTLFNLYDRPLKQLNYYNGKIDSLKGVYSAYLSDNKSQLKTIAGLFKKRSTLNGEAIDLLKENKKLIRKNKKISAEDRGEKDLYAAMNLQIEQMYEQQLQKQAIKTTYNNRFLAHLKLEKKLAKQENKELKKEKKIEDARYKRMLKYKKFVFDSERKRILERIKLNKANMAKTKRKY